MAIRPRDGDNNNSNNRNMPAPQKKKYKRARNSYEDFLQIISKLGKDLGSDHFECLVYNAEGAGVTCTVCCSDATLKGFYTVQHPVFEFSYHKFKKHCLENNIHFNRIKDEQLKKKHPKSVYTNPSNETTSNTDSVHSSLTTQLDRILNAIDLVHIIVKEGLPLNKAEVFNRRGDSRFVEHNMSSIYYTMEILKAMDCHQRQVDRLDVLGEDGKGDIALAFDGSSKATRSVKIFDMKGWKKGFGPVFKYCILKDAKKSIGELEVDLSDLLTADTGKDNADMIAEVVLQDLQIQWAQLCQLAVDGAAQNAGEWNGCVMIVCVYTNIAFIVF